MKENNLREEQMAGNIPSKCCMKLCLESEEGVMYILDLTDDFPKLAHVRPRCFEAQELQVV